MSDSVPALSRSRGWLVFGGVLSVIVGFMAMGSPLLFSLVIAQFLGIFALVSGVIALFLVIFGKHQGHRVLEAVLALIRIAAGVVLLRCVASSVAIITLILAIFFVVEGVHSLVGAIQMRAHKGAGWTAVSGVASLVLGLMVWMRWPASSAVVLGLLFGINSIFWGLSVLALGFGAPADSSSAAE